MIATLRTCLDCGYECFVGKDDLKERTCRKCGGLMKIIASEEQK